MRRAVVLAGVISVGCGARTGTSDHRVEADAGSHHVADAASLDAGRMRDAGMLAVDAASPSAGALPYDFDGDGIADVAIGAPGASRVYVYRGRAGGPSAEPTVVLHAATLGIGASLSARDADLDGLDELIVAGDDGVYFYRGPATGPRAPPFFTMRTESPEPARVACAGDLDADGRRDLLIAHTCSAAAWIARSSGRDDVHTFTDPSGCFDDDQLPRPAGDLDGNHRDDVVVAVDGRTEALVHLAPFGGPLLGVGFPTRIESARLATVGAGDLDGDGLPELAALLWNTRRELGIAYSTSWGSLNDWRYTPLEPATEMTFRQLTAPGDLDGDHRADLVIGGTEAATIFFGGMRGAPPVLLELRGELGFGTAVAAIGDVDADGRPNFAVAETGAVRVYSIGSDRAVREILRLTDDAPGSRFGEAILSWR